MAELKISKESQDDIAIWRNLERYPAWKRVVRELQKKIKEADNFINLIGGDSEIRYSNRDIAIIKKNAYLDLIEMPQKNVEMLIGTGTEPTEDLDAYEHPSDLEDPNDDL
jgi:PP-loop superfamily ATP-utilizing enzyme